MRKLLIFISFLVVAMAGYGCSSSSPSSDGGSDASTMHEGGHEGGHDGGEAGSGDAGCGTSSSKVVTLTKTAAGESPWAIAVDGTSIYWTSLGSCGGDAGAPTGLIVKMPLAGGSPKTLATGQGGPAAIAVDDKSVYWVNQCADDGRVMKTDLTGSVLTTLATGQAHPSNIAIDTDSVYFTTFDPTKPSTIGTISSVPISGVVDGGAPTTLASGQGQSAGLAVQGDHVYWAQANSPYDVNTVPTSGGSVKNLTPKNACDSLCAGVAGLTADSQNVYWSSLPAGGCYATYNIVSLPLAGGTATELAMDQGFAANLASDGQNLYWTNYGITTGEGQEVERISLTCDQVPTTLDSNQAYPRGIAVDATSVYWANSGSVGAIMKATPK
jgi:sugar lactone lactonase YvrE